MALIDRQNIFAGVLSRTGVPDFSLSPDLSARLQACLPKPIRQSLAQHHRRLVIESHGDAANLFFVSSQERQAIGEISPGETTTLPGIIHQRSKERRFATELQLPADDVLVRTVSFPAQVRGNLAQVLTYEIDRLSPFQANEVTFDFSLHSGAKHAERLTLDLAICRRDRIDSWLRHFSDLGVPIDRVTWQDAWPRANLLPAAERPRRRGSLFSISRLLTILAILLTTAVVLTPLWQKSRIIEALDAELRTLRTQAVAIDELRQELETARQGSTAVLQQKWEQAPMLEVLRELTDHLPDDTWIQSFEFNQGQAELRGESGQATALIALLEQAPGIEDVSFKSPVTQIARTGKERFNISFRFDRPSAE